MSVYFFGIALILSSKVILNYFFDENKRDEYLMLINSTYLIILSSVRSLEVGIDTKSYLRIFNNINKLSWKDTFNQRFIEKGYFLYNKILNNFRLVMIITSIFIIGSFSYAIHKYSKIKWLSLFLFCTLGFFNLTMNTSRQWIAIGILLYSIEYIKERKLIKFLGIIFLARLFHNTSICFIIAYMAPSIRLSNKFFAIISAFGLLLFFKFNLIINVGQKLSPKYFHYINSTFGASGNGYKRLSLILFLIIAGFFIRKIIERDFFMNLLFKLLIVAFLIQIVALNFEIVGRLVDYYYVYIIFYIPNYLEEIKNEKLINLKRFTLGVIIISTTSLYYYKLLKNTTVTVPYKTMKIDELKGR